MFSIFRKKEYIKYWSSRPTKTINRGTKQSAGLDFYVPNDFASVTISPGKSILVPSGIHVSFPDDYVLIAFNKSGVAAKKNLLVGAQVVDADYQGEIHLNLHNVGSEDVIVEPGDKLTQFILLKCSLVNPQLVSSKEDLYPSATERGTGLMGSTGTK